MNDEAREIDRELALAREAQDARIGSLDSVRRAKLWARIDEARDREDASAWGGASLLAFLRGAGIAAVAAAACMLFYMATKPGPAPRAPAVALGETRIAPKAEKIELEGLTLDMDAGTKLTLTELRVVEFEEGGLRLESVDACAIITPEARVSTFGGKIRVDRREGKTRVEAIEGDVEIARKGRRPEKLHAGQFAIISISTPAAAAAPVETKPSPPIVVEKPAAPARAPVAVAVPAEESARLVEDARTWVSRDAPRARAIAEDVLGTAPVPAVRVAATMLLADALRLEGKREPAAEAYGRVVTDVNPAAKPFREEALLREAQLFAELGHRGRALELLNAEPIESGLLRPERVALAVSLLLAEKRPVDAAVLLDRVPADRARALQRARLEVARALVDAAPARARVLLDPVLDDPQLASEARDLARGLPRPGFERTGNSSAEDKR